MSANEDVERGRSIKNPRGFPGLAELIAQDPDQETYVFRKFSKLTAWNLIYKQTELASYELEIDAIEAQLASDGHSDSVARSWKKLHEEAEKMGTCAHKIKELSDKISTKLSEYHSALLAASSIAQLKQPDARVLMVLGRFAGTAKVYSDLMATYLEEQNRQDLVALVTADHDAITLLLRDRLPGLLETNQASSQKTDYTGLLSERRIIIIKRILGVGLAATLPAALLVGSILALYFVTDDAARLGILLVFIIAFAFVVAITTSASRDSIFAATAAYAAVLIVFISGDLGNAKDTSASTASLQEALREALASISA